jgi:hypothetical protein
MIASRGDHRESPQWVDLALVPGELKVRFLEVNVGQQLARAGPRQKS